MAHILAGSRMPSAPTNERLHRGLPTGDPKITACTPGELMRAIRRGQVTSLMHETVYLNCFPVGYAYVRNVTI